MDNLDKHFTAQEVPKYVSFQELLQTSDVISVHLPLGPATQGLIGKNEFSLMKDGVIIVNTARGAIIDEEALATALESGKVWSVGLDVYEKEPEINPKLISHPGAVLLPHIGTATVDTQVCNRTLILPQRLDTDDFNFSKCVERNGGSSDRQRQECDYKRKIPYIGTGTEACIGESIKRRRINGL